MTFDEITKEVERKARAKELTDLERAMYMALLKALARSAEQ
jgi:hypothetical protein